MLILLQFATRYVFFLILTIENVNFIRICYNFFFFYFDNRTEFLIYISLQVECHLKQSKQNIWCDVLHLVLIVGFNWIRNVYLMNISDEKLCVYVAMTTELFIKYFCNIKLCCLWRFNDNVCYLLKIVCV